MSSQSIALTRPGGIEATPHTADHGGRRGIGPFVRHVVEMSVAMMIGMPLFGMPLRAVQGALLGPSSVGIPELRALGMAVAMTMAMVIWMRYRSHSSRATGEMAAAMIVPTVALFPMYWAGIISGGMLVGLTHVLMLPSMLAVMLYRRSEYGL
jgi:flagellar biosynthetic protein FliP